MAIVEALGNGILFGLLLALLIGPVFFALMQTSIEKGFSAGAGMAVGIALSDSLYIVVASLGVAALAENQQFQVWLGVGGGLIMLLFGLVNLFKKVVSGGGPAALRGTNNVWKELIKGFLLNGINPFVLLFWIGIASMLALNYAYDLVQKVSFFTAIIATVFLLDLAKAFAAHRLSRLLSPRFMTWMNRIVGIVLVLFSFRLFYFALESLQLLPEFAR